MSDHDTVSLRDFFESKFAALNEKLDGHGNKLDGLEVTNKEIINQTTKTNGRVGVLERNGKIVWAAIALLSVTLGSVIAVLLSNGVVTPDQIIK